MSEVLAGRDSNKVRQGYPDSAETLRVYVAYWRFSSEKWVDYSTRGNDGEH